MKNARKHSTITDAALAIAFERNVMDTINDHWHEHGCVPDIAIVVTRPMHRRLIGHYAKHGNSAMEDSGCFSCLGRPVTVVDSEQMACVSVIVPDMPWQATW